ncbi:SDR family NAD(P)-dependent oxidoreductase [Amycolatopsis pithecellobii]|uniref:SDR family NAD(P)-dependent oxidoreductase n=1 Tax=Amycolatopsis pithecellobii TaxID=664692 RepID=UPI00140D3EE9|nr:SDR family oxidoreductase [Amycolatopsis pithecellobii]
MSSEQAGNAWIVGGTRGIGQAVADELWQRGWTVVISGREGPQVKQVDDRRWLAGVDTRDSADVVRTHDRILERMPLDAVVNCASASAGGSIMTLTDDAWSAAIETKLLGYIRVCRTCLPGLAARGGALVNVIGASASVATADYAMGCLGAALVHLTRGLAQQWCPEGARVFGVNPGPTKTERLATLIRTTAEQNQSTVEQAEAAIAGSTYRQKPLSPGSLAHLIAELLGPAGEAVNGSVLLADGGSTGGWI